MGVKTYQIDRIWEDLKQIGISIKIEHTIFSLPFIFIGMVVAAGGWFGWKFLLLGVIAGFSARTFGMMVNRLVDREIDRLNPRTATRPTANGLVSVWEMVGIIGISGVIFIVTTYFANPLAFKLSFPILGILAGYSFTKRFTPFSHLFLGIALGLAPIAGAILVTGTVPPWSVFLGFGVMFWVAGFDVLYSIQDIRFDQQEGLFSIPALVGTEGALLFSRLFHLLALLFWGWFTFFARLGIWGWAGVGVVALILIWEQKLVAQDFQNIPRAFFDLNALLGMVYFGFIVLNYL